MTVLRIILGDQLSEDISALDGLEPGQDTVLMMEVIEECTYVRHHKQKIVLVHGGHAPLCREAPPTRSDG